MTIRDLSPNQIKELQDKCGSDFEIYLAREKAARRRMQTKEEIWKAAYSDGMKAALALREGNYGKNAYISKNGKPKSCSPKTQNKTVVVSELFDLVDSKTRGFKVELESDIRAVEFVIEQITKAIGVVARFDPTKRVDAIKRLAAALHEASESVNVAVFSKVKNQDQGPDLFSE